MYERQAEIRIAFDRKRIKRSLFSSLLFMGLGVYYLYMIPESRFHDYTFIGWVYISISIVIAIDSVSKLISKKPGFLINDEGICNFSEGYSFGPVYWTDIKELRMRKIFFRKTILIYVSNPQAYINKQKNWFSKITMSVNHILYDSPFCINAGDLEISVTGLFDKLSGKLTTQRNPNLLIS